MHKKIALFAFNGEGMCFAHVLINALDMMERGHEVKIVIEGSATKQIRDLADPDKPFAAMYTKVKEAGLLDCVCKACAGTMQALESAEEQGIELCGEMSGHPSIARYIDQGFEVLIF